MKPQFTHRGNPMPEPSEEWQMLMHLEGRWFSLWSMCQKHGLSCKNFKEWFGEGAEMEGLAEDFLYRYWNTEGD